ncbi:MAG: ribose 5-phosphate isomerase B [Vulcanimicrobiota bacterium]
MSRERISIGSDHAGFEVKEYIKSLLDEMGYIIDDVGTHNTDSVDYPVFAEKVAVKVAGGDSALGVISCGTGIGASIAANKVKGIRAALVKDEFTARVSREHNDANVLVLAGRPFDRDTVRGILTTWLSSHFEGGRHARRIEEIAQIENRNLGAPAS